MASYPPHILETISSHVETLSKEPAFCPPPSSPKRTFKEQRSSLLDLLSRLFPSTSNGVAEKFLDAVLVTVNTRRIYKVNSALSKVYFSILGRTATNANTNLTLLPRVPFYFLGSHSTFDILIDIHPTTAKNTLLGDQRLWSCVLLDLPFFFGKLDVFVECKVSRRPKGRRRHICRGGSGHC